MACPLPTLVLHQYSVLLCLGVLPFHYHRPLLALQLHYLCLTVILRQTFIKETSLEWIEWMCLLWPNLLEHSRWDGIGTKSWLNPPLPFIRRIWIRGSQCKAAITNTFTQRQTFLKWKNIPNNQNPVFGSFNHGRTKWRWKCLGFKLKKKVSFLGGFFAHAIKSAKVLNIWYNGNYEWNVSQWGFGWVHNHPILQLLVRTKAHQAKKYPFCSLL